MFNSASYLFGGHLGLCYGAAVPWRGMAGRAMRSYRIARIVMMAYRMGMVRRHERTRLFDTKGENQ